MNTAAANLAVPFSPPAPEAPTYRWFTANGCVVADSNGCRVYVGGNLIGQFERGDFAARNILVIGLAHESRVRRGKLARAFGISAELIRQLLLQLHNDGLAAVVNRRSPGAQRKMTDKMRERVEAMFDAGMTIAAAQAALRKSRKRVSLSLVGEVHREWKLRRSDRQEQMADDGVVEGEVSGDSETAQVQGDEAQGESDREPSCAAECDAPEADDEGSQPAAASGEAGAQGEDGAAVDSDADDEADAATPEASTEATAETDTPRDITPVAPTSAQHVQHLGVWVLLALLNSWDIYGRAQRALASTQKMRATTLRIAVDAMVAALAIGECCVEGVRRLATTSVSALLRAGRCPSPPWVRMVFGRAAKHGSAARFHLDVASHFVAEALVHTDLKRPVVFYIDNHMRPYTGQHTIRKGWRMQDRRARPGVTDYYVHDEGGRPVLRIDVPEHGHLTQWLPSLAELLRDAVGDDERILVAFDRGGSFPEHLAALRDMKVDFVTYERKPYGSYARTQFEQSFVDENERIRVHDTRANLGKKRGRVRRVALLMEDGAQVNLLAVSELTAEELYRVARGRWNQENGFKHGTERWGQNQLDGRTTKPVAPDTVIVNPARAQLDRAIRIARAKEGRLRCELLRVEVGTAKHAKLQAELARVTKDRRDFEAARPMFPKHARLDETPLAGKLRFHPGEYKMWIDSIRIACANAESELAALLAPDLMRPAEAKKVMSNLFKAEGDVRVSATSISVVLRPAGTKTEKRALAALLQRISAMGLSLPGDSHRRTVRFRSQD